MKEGLLLLFPFPLDEQALCKSSLYNEQRGGGNEKEID